MFLSTTTAEVEALKERNPRRGKLFEDSRDHMEETISSILTLNTIANTLGAVGSCDNSLANSSHNVSANCRRSNFPKWAMDSKALFMIRV